MQNSTSSSLIVFFNWRIWSTNFNLFNLNSRSYKFSRLSFAIILNPVSLPPDIWIKLLSISLKKWPLEIFFEFVSELSIKALTPDQDDIYSTSSMSKYFFTCLIKYSLSSSFAYGLSKVPEKCSVSVVPTIAVSYTHLTLPTTDRV